MVSFPVDILMEIFLRLSPRQLSRFRCVCKSWNSLLTSPSFVKTHLERLHKFDLFKGDLDHFSRVHVCHPSRNELFDLDMSFVKEDDKFTLVGSCNGIVCLSTFDSNNPSHPKIFLWNPSTCESIALPQPSHRVSNLVGFGFDPSSGHPDDFKVVNVSFRFEQRPDYTSQVEMFSFRRNCWKQLGNIFPPSLTQHLGDQVIFEKFICWCPCFPFNREVVKLLVLFDVVKDVFQTIALPDIMPSEEIRISLLEGRLSLIAHNSSIGHYEVWIMNGFVAAHESWTKLYTIGVPTIDRMRFQPLGFANSGDVVFVITRTSGLLFSSRTYLALYNVWSEGFEAINVKTDSNHGARLVTCMESLISLSAPINGEQ